MTASTVDVEITLEDIKAAQAGENWAIELVLGTLQGNATKIATTHAYRWPGGDFADLVEEFKQVANVAMWGALDKFDADSVDKFYAFMHRKAEYAVIDRFTEMRHPGSDRESIQIFAQCVRMAEGDLDLAESLCQSTKFTTNRRLGKDRAHAARLAWTSTVSLDAPLNTRDDSDDVATLADYLVSKTDLPDELITSDDLAKQQRELRIELVNVVLNSMSEAMQTVLKATYGIAPFGEYGTEHDEELAALVGIPRRQVGDKRSKSHLAFAKRFVPLVTEGNEEAQAEWWAAFYAERAK
jgi:DNA-directed RNA polymerase specialized sigma subunit